MQNTWQNRNSVPFLILVLLIGIGLLASIIYLNRKDSVSEKEVLNPDLAASTTPEVVLSDSERADNMLRNAAQRINAVTEAIIAEYGSTGSDRSSVLIAEAEKTMARARAAENLQEFNRAINLAQGALDKANEALSTLNPDRGVNSEAGGGAQKNISINQAQTGATGDSKQSSSMPNASTAMNAIESAEDAISEITVIINNITEDSIPSYYLATFYAQNRESYVDSLKRVLASARKQFEKGQFELAENQANQIIEGTEPWVEYTELIPDGDMIAGLDQAAEKIAEMQNYLDTFWKNPDTTSREVA